MIDLFEEESKIEVFYSLLFKWQYTCICTLYTIHESGLDN